MKPWDGVPIQNTAPIPNDIDWYLIALTIIAGSALISFGIGKSFERWEDEIEALPEWFSILGEILGIAVAMAGASLAGYLVWNWMLGILCGAVGGWGAPFIVTWLNRYISKETNPRSKKYGRAGTDSER